MYQNLIIVGNLGKDPDMRYAPDGTPVTSFSVAAQDGFGEKKKTIWFRVSAWKSLAETCHNYLHKGSKVLVEGVLVADETGGPRVYKKSDGTPAASFEVRAMAVKFLSPKDDAGTATDEEVPF